MFEGTYKFAGIKVKINSQYEYIHSMCEEYACGEDTADDPGIVEVSIAVSPEDIELEKQKCIEVNEREGRAIQNTREPYLESLAVYRKITEEFAKYNVVLFHGSAAAIDGQVYLFTAKSGTGKSTHSRLWREAFGDKVVMVNDDKPLIKITEDEVQVYGTPWNGKHNLSVNTHLPLKAICYLNRGDDNSIEEIDYKEIYPILLQQTYRPRKPDDIFKVLEMMEILGRKVKFYKLYCNMDPEAAYISYEGMK